MNFLLSEELVQFRDVLRALLAKELAGAELRRGLLDPYSGQCVGGESPAPLVAPLWRKIADAGVLAAALPDSVGGRAIGGLGLGAIALQVMLEEAGRALVPLPVFETLVFGALPLLAVDAAADSCDLLASIAAGEMQVSGAFFRSIGDLPEARSVADGILIDGDLQFVSSLPQCASVLVPARYEGACALFIIDSAACVTTTVPTLDLLRRFSRVSLRATPAKRVGGVLQDGASAALHCRQQLACVAELVGVGQRVLEMTVEYVKTRQQFGRPIGSFQAIQHKLADMSLHVEQATSLGRFAAWAADNDPAQLSSAALAAKGFASEVIPVVVEQAIQAHGGIGFTYEYDLHLYLRRARLLAALGTPTDEAYAQLGAQLLA